MPNAGSATARQFLPEDEEQRRSQHQKGQHSQKGVGRGPQQKNRARNSASQAGDQKWQQDAHGHIQAVAIGTAAGGRAGPQRQGVGGVRGNRRHSGEQQGGKGHKAASARDRVQRSA